MQFQEERENVCVRGGGGEHMEGHGRGHARTHARTEREREREREREPGK